jgi:hypothetical protein
MSDIILQVVDDDKVADEEDVVVDTVDVVTVADY